MTPPNLNTDVLAEIVAYLPTYDALKYGSTCHFLRKMAIRRAISCVHFNSSKRLYQFSAFVLTDPTARAPYLRSLSLSPKLTDTLDGLENALKILVILLMHSTNLASLSLPNTDLLLMFESHLAPAIASLPALTSLSLSSIGNDTQNLLLRLRSAPVLERLYLSNEWTMSQHHDSRLSTDGLNLPPLPRLRVLKMSSLRGNLPSCAPALRELHLSRMRFVDPIVVGAQHGSAAAPWWPSGQLDLVRADLPTLWAIRIPHPVRALEIDDACPPSIDEGKFTELATTLTPAAPQRLTLRLAGESVKSLWKVILPLTTRLHYLDISVDADDSDWLSMLSGPGPSTLLCLSVTVTRATRTTRATAGEADPGLLELATHAAPALTAALPSLCLLAFGLARPTPATIFVDLLQARNFSVARAAALQCAGGNQDSLCVRNVRHDKADGDNLLWLLREDALPHAAMRAVSGGGVSPTAGNAPRRWQSVGAEAGMRLRKALRGADFEQIGDLDKWLARCL